MSTSERQVRLASIWAQDKNRVLGSGTAMLWNVPADSQFFKRSTLGSPILMGRSSWEALGSALPGRTNIVITRDPEYVAPGAIVTHTLEDAISIAVEDAVSTGADTAWVTGGAHVYEQTMPLVDEVVVTQLDLTVPSDGGSVVRAPELDPAVWQEDPARSDTEWREQSGDARWKVTTYVRR